MRIPVSNDMLAHLVGEQLEARIASGGEFTAYDITRSLRYEQPQLDIPHAAVRSWVHGYMQAVVAGGMYTASQRAFGTEAAVVYEPALVTMWPTMPVSMN
jgi:hypothetical protein